MATKAFDLFLKDRYEVHDWKLHSPFLSRQATAGLQHPIPLHIRGGKGQECWLEE
jgi:hypothetical protein